MGKTKVVRKNVNWRRSEGKGQTTHALRNRVKEKAFFEENENKIIFRKKCVKSARFGEISKNV